MKKLYSFALLILVLMSSVILSACGTNYDNLSMSFVSLSGTSIERVELNIDKNNDDLNNDTVRIGVRFDGISEGDIGNIIVQSRPSGLVTVSNYVYEGNIVYFTIRANNPTTGATLEVKHLSSDKTASCNLYIGQKSTDITVLSNRYIISIPEEGSKDSIIDASSLVRLYLNGSTDNIYFTSLNASSLQNVEFITTNVDNQNYITGFRLNSNVTDGDRVTLYPVTYMNNYEPTTYSNQPIEFVFKQVLTDSDVVLSSDSLHDDYLLAGEPIYLIENDNTAVNVDGQSYNYSNLKLNFMQDIDGELFDIDNYLDFYDYDFYSTSESIRPMLTGEGIVVQANDYTNDVEEVTISLVPKDCVGEIVRIDKTIRVKGETKPEDIDVYMQGQKIDVSESIDLYDYYQSSSNTLGALFNFTPIETYAMQDFKTMQFSIAPEILNAYLTINNENVGQNPIYSNNTFTTMLTNPQDISTEHTVRNNRYVLEIFVGNQPMKFYYDETTNRLVSETIYENQSIYIRYTETTIATNDYELGLDVISFYSGDLDYLTQISPISVSLQFNREDGVTNLIVNAGQLSLSQTTGGVQISTVQNADGTDVVATDVYLNRLNGMDANIDSSDRSVSSSVLYIGSSGVLGINDRIISSATFNVTVTGGRNNPLKLKQYDLLNDGNGKHATGESSITYNFNQTGGTNSAPNNAILFVYDINTDIVEYTITFTHANGYTYTITCHVYQDLTYEDINYNIDENTTAFKNSVGENEYLFEGYTADYIVASGQNLNFEVVLDQVFTTEPFVTGYEITPGILTVANINISDYFDVTSSDNRALLRFLRGSYINNENVYFTLNISVYVNYYENILTPAGTKAVSRIITFFIYDEIGNNDISINTTNPNLYIYDQLGIYYKDRSEVELVVSLTNNNLWNYVQSYEQNTDQIGIDNTTGDNIEETGNNLRRVVWTTTGANGLETLAQTDYSISLRANSAQTSGAYSRTIVAIIRQFNTEFSFVVQINVREPILTDRIEITSNVSVRDDDRENPYINLRAGESYQITANNYSTDGAVTNPDIFLVVADRFGNSDYNSVQVDNDTNTITVRDSIASTEGLQLIVFARDVLGEIINSYSQGFNDPQSYIIDGEGLHYYQYKNAYIVIDLILSDGTRSNPYLIQNGDEFWQITEDVDAHYRLMTNVDVSNTTYTGARVIDNFTGTITTDSYTYGEGDNQEVRTFSYSLFGIELTENNPNLFTNFEGSIENVSFSVTYNYNFTSNMDSTQISTIYLGVFDRMGANETSANSLTNVSVNASGNVNFNSTDNYVFGALVGRNSGNISYTSNAVIGANVNLQLSGSSQVYFGGLVGENVGTIAGYNQDNTANTSLDLTRNNAETIDSEIIFSVLIAGEGAMSNITLNSTLTNNNSVIGGVIGVNTYESIDNATRVGTLKDAYVTGTINAQTDNVGGVVGRQIGQTTTFNVNIQNNQIASVGDCQVETTLENITSSVQISGRNNVGGVVGTDNGGYYKNVHYQILEADTAYLTGIYNVGGIAGASRDGYFDTCSVMSYRFNYDELATTFSGVHADIIGEDFVGGIVGLATNSLTTSTLGAGDNSISATLVKNSSVNAYLESNGEGLNAIGGIMSLLEDDPTTTTTTEGGFAIVFNSYFLGKLSGNVYYHNLTLYNDTAVALASNSHYLFNIAYTVDVKDDGSVVERSFHTTNTFEIKYNSSTGITEDAFKSSLADYWGYREDLNGGYIFISKVTTSGEGDDAVITSLHTPIYELAPTSLSALVKDEYSPESTNTLLHLNYYNFNIDITNSNYITILNALNEEYNTHNLKDLFDFSYTPNSLEEVRIYATSGNLNVITIINDRLVINGVGETTLTFRSILNPQVYATVTVVVTYPVDDSFSILDGENNVDASEQRIALNHAKQYYTSANGEVEYDGEKYSYQTNDEVYLRVEITTQIDSSLDGQDINTDPYHYLNISGLTPTLDDGSNAIIIPYTVPFSISVRNYVEGVTFIVNVRPFTTLTYNDEEIRNYILDDLDEANAITFTLIPAFGATNISLDFDHAIMYPNDTTIITAYINTDLELDDEEISSFVSAVQIDNENVDISTYIEYLSERTVYNQNTNIQTVYFRLNLENLDVGSLNEPIDLVVRFTLTNGRSANAEFTILPQRINKIEVNNYVYTSREDQEISKSNVLRPDGQGIILIEIAPENGYYDYLEISDITGEEEIVFTQVDGIAGSRLDMNLPSSDGTGIRLVKVNGITYVETRISRNYSTREHTVSVRAYLSDGTLIAENQIIVDVRMLPGIQLDYIDPNGVVTRTNTDIDYGHDYYLANGVDADFRVTTDNSDGNVDVTLTLSDGSNANGYFEFVLGNNGFYTLRSTYNTDLLGKTLTITVSTRATDENGNYEIAQTQMNLTIVDFVIHNVSVTNSRVDFTTNPPDRIIYGDYNTAVQLEFYFNPTDISFYNSSIEIGDNFWNQTYRYDETLSDVADEDANSVEKSLIAINNILGALNTDTAGTGGRNKFITPLNQTEEDKENLTLTGNTLVVQSGNVSTILSLQFKLELDANNGYVWTMSENTNEDITNTNLTTLTYTQDYSLEFVNSNSYEDPIVILDEDDFINMTSGENVYYILANDLTLRDYTPLDVNFRMFDGNGHTITIQSFEMFGEAEIRAGLFREIYDGMIVANLTVRYNGRSNAFGSYELGVNDFRVDYADLCQNPDVNYTSADFGGITPVNNGIITNCVVEGMVALSASTVENSGETGSSGRYTIDFNIGGLVSTNGSTGYITNSISRLKIFAQANIGGLVHTNNGKIVASEFDASDGNGLIYAYNRNVETTIISSIAGFVVSNTGEISMSNVKVGQTTLSQSTYIGNMSAKDISAGFVYSNTGSIYDAYVNLTRIGENNNTFSGFVNSNSGTINRTYTFINNGNKSSSVVNMFAPQNTTGITNSIEIINITAGYNNRIENLTTLNLEERFVISNYSDLGFTFGDNTSAVWTQTTLGVLPSLVVEGETVTPAHTFRVGDSATVEIEGIGEIKGTVLGSTNSAMNPAGLRAIVQVEYDVTDEAGHVTETTDYVVLNNGYGSRNNPYLIYDITSWDNYFTDNSTGYYRLITDIDFSSVYNNPSTADKTFRGNLQGNNMEISGLTIYSSSSLDSIGLFESLAGGSDISIENSVRNLTISANSVLASKTTAVGLLAGRSDNFNIYNVHVDSSGLIVVGKNAVGGMIGLVEGEFDIDNVSSNVGANSTRETSDNSYQIYLSINNGGSTNLTNVYYAGSLFGILDGYNIANFNINANRDIVRSTYYEVRNANSTGNVTILGDIVGGMFGFVGERVRVDGASANITGTLNGRQYSAGLVGENRGVITNSSVISSSENMFSSSSYVGGGIVGLNLGGIVMNSSANINVNTNTSSATAGGIVGRNVNGYVTNVYQSGNVLGYFAGAVIGTSYSRDVFISRQSGSGSLQTVSQVAVPTSDLTYLNNTTTIENLTNINISRVTLEGLFANMRTFYAYGSGADNIEDAFASYRIYGLLIGAISGEDVDSTVTSYGYLTEKGVFSTLVINEVVEHDVATNTDVTTNIFANTIATETSVGTIVNAQLFNGAVKVQATELTSAVGYDIEFVNYIYSSDFACSYITYLVGAEIDGFDNWNRRSYGTERLAFTNSTEIDELILRSENVVAGYVKNVTVSSNSYNFDIQTASNVTEITINAGFVQSYFENAENIEITAQVNETTVTISNNLEEISLSLIVEDLAQNITSAQIQITDGNVTYVFTFTLS